MKLLIIGLILISSNSFASEFNRVKAFANKNGFKPTNTVINSIINASHKYHIDSLELTAIGIIETGLGRYSKDRQNKNGTIDRGIFQINSKNFFKCIEYDLFSPQGSSFCAAKLISSLKKRNTSDYLGRYHSKTPSIKEQYIEKITKVFIVAAE